MNRKNVLGSSVMGLVFLLICLCCTPTLGAESASAPRPNVVIILIDDMGWSDLSCFGNKVVETPNIDRFASEGIAFTQFYVCAPICSPSRCGILTGQYPHRWRINSFLANRKENADRGMNNWLDPSAPTMARFFHNAGYATGHFGKWHLGGQRDVGDAPLITEYGFDKSLTNFEGLGPRVLPLLNAFDGAVPRKHALGSDTLGRGEIRWEDRNKVTGCFVDAAIEFIEDAKKENKPFFVNLWPDDVHSPFFPSKELRGDESKKALYHGVLVEMDRQLARLFDYIRGDAKLRDNTIVVFCSDNGPEPGAGSSQPLRGNKGMLYEGGTRSPLIVWGKGLLAPQSVGTKNSEALFHSLDLAPSLLKIAGVDVPQNVKFDGEDFSDVLLGKTVKQVRKSPIFWRRPPDRPGPPNNAWPDLALYSGPWKFLMQFDGSNPQLYDLTKDQPETTNLAEQNTVLVEEFRQTLKNWSDSMPPMYLEDATQNGRRNPNR